MIGDWEVSSESSLLDHSQIKSSQIEIRELQIGTLIVKS